MSTDAENLSEALQNVVDDNKKSPIMNRMRALSESIVADTAGNVLQSDYDVKVSLFITKNALELKEAARSAVRDIDPCDELTFLRVKSRKQEMFLCHEDEFSIISIRKDNQSMK